MKDNLKTLIGNRVRDIRLDMRITQEQFAEAIDISINFLSEIENGKKGMSQETIYKLCSYYDVSADYLILGKKEEILPPVMTKITDIAVTMNSQELEHTINYLTSLKKMKDLKL